MANHLYQVVVNFQVLAAKGSVDWSVPADYLHGDWRKQFAAEVDNLVAAWAAPGSEEGVSPGWGIASRTVGHMALLDLTLHAWDLARATGRRYEPAPEAVAEIGVFIDAMAPMARDNKVFGPEFPVPADAPAFARILGAAGRKPGLEGVGVAGRSDGYSHPRRLNSTYSVTHTRIIRAMANG
ncbi:TIGR03086 family metal-binding protein [Yinghuangia aomiensis]